MSYAIPSPQTIINNASALGGRVSRARGEMLSLLFLALPPAVEALNANENISVIAPKQAVLKRQLLEENAFPALVVNARVVGDPTEPPRSRFRSVQMIIFIVTSAGSGREQDDDLWDLAELVDMTLLEAQGGWKNPDNKPVWSSLELEEITDELGDGWDGYAGIKLIYTAHMGGLRGFDPIA